MVDIEPCWWCGRDAKSQWFLAKHWVGCGDKFQCGARGPCADTPEAAIAAWNRVAGQRWRPIETAPRDGTEVDLSKDGRRFPNCHHHCGEWLWWNTTSVDDEPSWLTVKDPTHWRPLPDPPEGDTP